MRVAFFIVCSRRPRPPCGPPGPEKYLYNKSLIKKAYRSCLAFIDLMLVFGEVFFKLLAFLIKHLSLIIAFKISSLSTAGGEV